MSAGCFAIMLVIARRSRKTDVLGGTFMAGIFSAALGAVAAFLLDGGIGINQTDLAIILFMGAFTIGLGIALVTTGTGYLPAAEVSLLVLIESVLGPLWPWLFLGEALLKYGNHWRGNHIASGDHNDPCQPKNASRPPSAR